ncbi:MAG: hypothetical protein ABGY41_21235, partial [Candidatus Poribacteria bacterium]
ERRARLGLFVWLFEEFYPERGVSVEDDRSRSVLSAKADTVQCAQYAQHEHRPPLGQKTWTTPPHVAISNSAQIGDIGAYFSGGNPNMECTKAL